jgi:mono/diheme cytochrome c family protein
VSPGRIRRLAIATRRACFTRYSLRADVALFAIAAGAALAGCGPPTSGKSSSELYAEHCTRCHGDDGRGDPRALTLSPNADLTRSALVRRQARGPIFVRISQGMGSMPAFSHKLEIGDIELLIDYVLELPAPEQQGLEAR